MEHTKRGALLLEMNGISLEY